MKKYIQGAELIQQIDRKLTGLQKAKESLLEVMHRRKRQVIIDLEIARIKNMFSPKEIERIIRGVKA